MSRSRGSYRLPHLVRAAAVLAATGCLYAGMGAAAWADEFRIFDVHGDPLSFERVSIEDSRGEPWRTMRTDGDGRLVVPYKGRVEIFRAKFEERQNGNTATQAGTLFVDGRGGVKDVRLR